MIGIARGLVDTAESRDGETRSDIDDRSSIEAEFALQWQSQGVRHTDCLYLPAINLWQDFFPPALQAGLSGSAADVTLETTFAAGELVPPHDHSQCLTVPATAFRSRYGNRTGLQPRSGRFYPKGIIAGVHNIYPEDVTPFRVTDVSADLAVDLNHPLSDRALTLTTSVMSARPGNLQGGTCRDVAELLCNGGPGMQARCNGRPTDFWSGDPMRRGDEAADADFYAEPRLLNHVDATAIAVIESLYAELLPESGKVLDLMAAWRSHLPERPLLAVTGLGMNRAELEANPRLAEYCIQDLNANPVLAYDDDSFVAVVCTASIEYLTRPAEVLAQVRRVLQPGGRFIVTFSNRWFPPKAIAVWADCHEFERLGLVLDYFLEDGGFDALASWSLRGLPRPAGDRYAGRLSRSDPVYAVWGEKAQA